VDETLDQKEPAATAADAARLIAQARELLVPTGASDFARRYAEAMQRDPAAVLAHGAMMQVFAELGKEAANRE
jgi:hypothetical protein